MKKGMKFLIGGIAVIIISVGAILTFKYVNTEKPELKEEPNPLVLVDRLGMFTDKVTVSRSDLDYDVKLIYMDFVGMDVGEYYLEEPVSVGLEMDYELRKAITDSLCHITAEEIVDDNPSEVLLEKAGITNPRMTVKAGADYILTVGNKTENGYYATISGKDGLYVLNEESLPLMTADFFGMIKNPLLNWEYDEISSVTVKVGDTADNFVLKINNSGYLYPEINGEETMYSDFKEFYYSLTYVPFDGIRLTEPESGTPDVVVIFRNKYGFSETFSYYEQDGEYIIKKGGNVCYSCPESYIDSLKENLERIRNGEPVITDLYFFQN